MKIKFALCVLLFIPWWQLALAQPVKYKPSLKDSSDHALDFSDWIIQANGFVPVPYIITEPALGGFGGALIPVFIKKNPPYYDTVGSRLKITPVAPNITGGIGVYTTLLRKIRSCSFIRV